MKKLYIVSFVMLIVVMTACKHKIKVTYPETRKVDSTDTYFGQKIADPYRWLENDTSAQTAAWVEAENKVTNEYLAQIPFREQIRKRLTKIWNYPRFGVPFREGPYYFYFKNDGLQNQSVMYARKGLEGEPWALFDPNKLSADGTVALAGTSVSKDGKYLALSLSRSGSDWNEIQVMEIESGKMLADTINWVKFSMMSWERDGFYYSRYDAPGTGTALSGKNEFHKVYYHKVGTPQKEDKLIFQNLKFPQRNYGAQATDDGHFLILYESESTSGTALYFRNLQKNQSQFKLLAEGFDYEYEVIDNLGDQLLVVTNYKAPKKKLILMDPENPAPEKWQTIVPERDDVLESVSLSGDYLVTIYMQNASSKAFIYETNGKFLHEMNLPGIGTLSGFKGKKGDDVAFYGFTSFTYPMTIFKYDVYHNNSSVYNSPEIDFDATKYEVRQLFYLSKDNTTIPMFVVHKKGVELDGSNPVLLYGYGGFNVSLTPSFSLSRLIFLENGGIYVIANIRGGGEYGEEWHKAGTKERKQNVFDDFIAAAEYLIKEKYTSSDRLAIMGGSNGGLLVGACMTQRPDLFKVAIPQVGVMDMLRYHKFTIGWAWASDYGTSDTKEGFDYLIKYSPLHNIKDSVSYPATLAFTADHDDRVVPAHTFKFIATMQEKNRGDNPILVRIETKAGHGAGKPTAKMIDEMTDLWSFVMFNLGMSFSEK
ncbi:MAG: prolyl oligopeptidase family serine peptidase [Bacteroidales bacterium]|nr:prolyl oligopeptidase family serine peptidase [Bacteroidales bacterium]